MEKDFDWSLFIDRLWERENAKGKKGVEGKGGYRKGKYYPYEATNGKDIGPGIDLGKQSDEFRKRAEKGLTKEELDTVVRERLEKEKKYFNQRIAKEGGDTLKIPENVYGGLYDMYWQIGNGLYQNYPKFWKGVAQNDYDSMQRESATYYEPRKGAKISKDTVVKNGKVLDEGRWNFRKQTYFNDPGQSDQSTTAPYNDGNLKELVENLPSYEGTPMTTPYNDGWLPGKKADGGPLNTAKMWNDLSVSEKSEMMKAAIRNGITNLNDIKEKYNEFATGGPKQNKSTAINKIRERLYETIDPNGDYYLKKHLDNFVSGRPVEYEDVFQDDNGDYKMEYGDAFMDLSVSDGLWAEYLQIPPLKRHFYSKKLEQSQYKPSMGGNKNKKYYKLPLDDYDVADLIEETNELPLNKNAVSTLLEHYNLGPHTIGRGVDKDKGEYRSYFDKWDINPFTDKYEGTPVPLLSDLGDASFGIGKPLNIYDRIYLDDYYDYDSSKNVPKNTYYGGWLPEVVIHPEKRPEAFMLSMERAFGGPIVQRANKFSGTEQPTQQMDRVNQPLYDGQIGFGFGYNPETFERYYTGFYNPFNNSYNNATWVDENDEYNIGLPTVTIRPSGESMVNRAQEKAAPVVRDVLLGSAALAGGIPLMSKLTPEFLAQMAVGMAGGEAVDAASKGITGNSWGENISKAVDFTTGWNPEDSWWGSALADMTNPGYMLTLTPFTKLAKSGQWLKQQYNAFDRNIMHGKALRERLRKEKSDAFQASTYLGFSSPYWLQNSTLINRYPAFKRQVKEFLDKSEKLASLEDAWNMRAFNFRNNKGFRDAKKAESKLRLRTVPDFSKMSDAQVEKWLDKNFPYDKDELWKYWNSDKRRFEQVIDGGAFNPNNAVTTGDIDIVDAATGKTTTYHLDEIPLSHRSTAIFPAERVVAPNGNIYNRSATVSSGNSAVANAFFPEAPQDYLDAVGKNIDFITNDAVKGSKVFGSSANVRAGNLYHDAHDIDVIMPFKEAKKHKEFSNWSEIRPGATYNYNHPTAGPIDVNVIMEDSAGHATGTLAHELYAELYPKEYADLMKKAIQQGKTPSVDIPLDKSASELFDAFDPVQKSIIDTFASAKPKHMNRAYYLLNYGKLNDVRKGFDSYMKYVTGGRWEPTKVTLSEFNDPAVNSKLIDDLGLMGINKEQFINDPERMKLLFDYSIYENTFVGRGFDTMNKSADDIIKSATYWYPNTTGGTAKGVGLNTVMGGNSGYGNVYVSMVPNRMGKLEGTTVQDVLNEVQRNIGNIKLNDGDITKLREIARSTGIPEQIISDHTTLSEILNNTSGRTGQNYKDFLSRIAEEFDIPLITNGSFGSSKYASLLEDQSLDNVVQIFPQKIDRPHSLQERAEALPQLDSSEMGLLEQQSNARYRHKYMGDYRPLTDDYLQRARIKINEAYNKNRQAADQLSQKQYLKYNELLNQHYKYVENFQKVCLGVLVGSSAGLTVPLLIHNMTQNRVNKRQKMNENISNTNNIEKKEGSQQKVLAKKIEHNTHK